MKDFFAWATIHPHLATVVIVVACTFGSAFMRVLERVLHGAFETFKEAAPPQLPPPPGAIMARAHRDETGQTRIEMRVDLQRLELERQLRAQSPGVTDVPQASETPKPRRTLWQRITEDDR